jgi:hypothetical protein
MKKVVFDFCGNLGGITRLYAIPWDTFRGLSHDYTKGLSYLNVLDCDEVIEIYCTEDTLNFTEEKTQPGSGATYRPVLTGIIPKENRPNRELLTRLECNAWLVLFRDSNGNIRLAGDGERETLMVFNRTSTTGQSPAARNQMEFTFSGEQSHACYFIEPDGTLFS